jgi:hypothetical protein
MYADSKQLMDALRSEASTQRRDDIILAALTDGVSPRDIELVLDQIEFESQLAKQKLPAGKPNIGKPNIVSKLYCYIAHRYGRQNADVS